MSSDTLVVNLFGGPCTGKSATASGLYNLMKKEHYSVELINEYAKGVVWEKSFTKLENQIYVFAKQHQYSFRCQDQVDVVITDSPINLGLIYGDKYTRSMSDPLRELIRYEFNNQNNLNVVLNRNPDRYDEVGRMQTLEEALKVDEQIIELLDKGDHPYHVLDLHPNVEVDVFELVKQHA